MVARVAGEAGAGEFERGAAERDDDRGAEGGGDVHGAGIVGQQGAAELQPGAKLGQAGLAGEIENGVFAGGLLNCGGDAGGEGGVGFRAEDEPAAAEALVDLKGGGNEAVLGPAFGGAVFRAGIEAE